MKPPAGAMRIVAVLAGRNFGIYMAGTTASLIGMWAQRIGIGWLAWELTHSAFWVGVVAAADLAPGVIISPLAGIVGDRHDRLKLVRLTQMVSAATSAAMAAMVLSGTTEIVLLTILATIQGTTMAFKLPARMALIRALVDEDDLGTAIALNAVVFNIARFLGPSVAGLLILLDGVGSVFVLALVASIVFVVALQFVQVRPYPLRDEFAAGETGALQPLVGAGYAYAFGHPGIGPLLVLQLSAGLFIRGLPELLPSYSAAVLDQGAEGLAALSASIGFGAIIAGLWMAQREGAAGLTRRIFLAQAGCSVCLVVLAATGSLLVACLLVALLGSAITTTGIACQTLIQRCTPEDRMARVMAVYGILARATPALGALLMGAAADLVGFAIPLVMAGAMSLVSVGLLMRREAVVRTALEIPGSRRA